MREKEIGIAVVGSGRMGELRAQLAANHPGVRFVACADSDAARAKSVAEKVGAQFHSGNNHDVIAHPEVDAVIVSTPNYAHLDAMLQAIELGKAVLCEKPIGLALDDANQIMEAIERYNGNVRFGYSRRFKERYLRAKEQVVQGRLGKIVGGHARAYNLRSQARGKRGRKIVETPVVTSLTYYIDLMCWFLEGNPVVEVYARGNSSGRQDGVSDNVHELTWALLTCADGAAISAGIYYGLPEQYPSRGLSSRVELLGSEGVLLIDGDNTDEILYTERGVPHVHLAGQEANMVFLGSSTPGSWALGDFWGPLATETRAWLDHLTTGRPCALATAADARRNLEISLAIERSEWSGETVRLPIER